MTLTVNGYGSPAPVKLSAVERVIFPLLGMVVVPLAMLWVVGVELVIGFNLSLSKLRHHQVRIDREGFNMLAQNFKSAADLEISEPQREALMKTLVMLETGKLEHVPLLSVKPDYGVCHEMNAFFNMIVSYGHVDCGSVGCLRGTAERVGNVSFPIFPRDTTDGLHDLFYNGRAIASDPGTEQAARALRSYLTTGNAKWLEALA